MPSDRKKSVIAWGQLWGRAMRRKGKQDYIHRSKGGHFWG